MLGARCGKAWNNWEHKSATQHAPQVQANHLSLAKVAMLGPVDAWERLHHIKKKRGKGDQHAFSPESVLHIIGLDIIATSCSADNVAENQKNIKFATSDIADN